MRTPSEKSRGLESAGGARDQWCMVIIPVRSDGLVRELHNGQQDAGSGGMWAKMERGRYARLSEKICHQLIYAGQM